MNNQQLAEAIVKELNQWLGKYDLYLPVIGAMPEMTATILPLIAEFKKEVAGDAWDAGYDYDVYATGGGTEKPDRKTYIDNLNK